MQAGTMTDRSSRPTGSACRAFQRARVHLVLAAGVAATLVVAGSTVAAADVPDELAVKHVLIIQSYGNDLAPFTELSSSFRSGLARSWPGPVQYHEVSLEITGRDDEASDRPLVTYIRALDENRRPDLAVMIGGPASRFGLLHRHALFPATPMLLAGPEQRLVLSGALTADDATVASAQDFRGTVESILRLLPETENVVVVVGVSALERFWRAELEREFKPLENRVRFTYWDGQSLEEMESRAAHLPPRSAILYALLLIDGAGVPHASDRALARLHATANAPIFGLFDSQVGQGVVGGSLVSISELSRRCVDAAVGVLRGEPPFAYRSPPLGPGPPVFDGRELHRWGIRESRLPPGSTIRFRPQSVWSHYRWPILGGLSAIGLLATLVVGLTLSRVRRRAAEQEVRTLNRRLLTAFEDERRRLGRELHDDVSQRLARLAIDAARIEADRPATPAGTEPVSVREEIVKLSADVHALSRRLHPAMLDDLGVVEALRAEGERFARAEAIGVALKLEAPDGALPRDTALGLYRVAQEALRNVARHARAGNVTLALRPRGRGVELEVRDDGVGFDPAARRGSGLGLASMVERMHLVGGTLAIRRAPQGGTIVVAWVPVEGSQQ
ncbi:MAG: ATPase [Acidobacteria bacterium]|nr:ATPase [Acidobacteriota bacterium]